LINGHKVSIDTSRINTYFFAKAMCAIWPTSELFQHANRERLPGPRRCGQPRIRAKTELADNRGSLEATRGVEIQIVMTRGREHGRNLRARSFWGRKSVTTSLTLIPAVSFFCRPLIAGWSRGQIHQQAEVFLEREGKYFIAAVGRNSPKVGVSCLTETHALPT